MRAAKPWCDALNARGTICWHLDCALKLGDNIRASVDEGMSRSRYGVVIGSKPFLEKRWTQDELIDLATRQVDGKKMLLPVWHNVGFREICDDSPILSDRVAISTDKGFEYEEKIDAAKQPGGISAGLASQVSYSEHCIPYPDLTG
jgi:TIR domain